MTKVLNLQKYKSFHSKFFRENTYLNGKSQHLFHANSTVNSVLDLNSFNTAFGGATNLGKSCPNKCIKNG
jgi:hypothetical protein